MKITTVIGARPQFIKASFLSKRFDKAGVKERIIHTGQHYDKNMSDVFFTDLGIPEPALNFGVGSQSHGAQTGCMLSAIENDLESNRTDALLVYGDTNSTLAGALAAVKLHIPVIHIESGLRSFDKQMPEEINRILTDHVSRLLFCPTVTAVKNLMGEGIEEGVNLSGDVMHRVLLDLAPVAKSKINIEAKFGLGVDDFYLATIHRAENTDDCTHLIKLMDILGRLDKTVFMPMHPRTRQKLIDCGWQNKDDGLIVTSPRSYLDMLALIQGAAVIITDSGGLQKEAAWLLTPCVTLRNTTEWIETVESGWNKLTGVDEEEINKAIDEFSSTSDLIPVCVSALHGASIIELIKQI